MILLVRGYQLGIDTKKYCDMFVCHICKWILYEEQLVQHLSSVHVHYYNAICVDIAKDEDLHEYFYSRLCNGI